MKFTLSWLKDHLETDASLETILEKLTALGLIVDKVENKAEALAPFKICEILETEKHPNADRLQVCRVNTGTEVIQVVCGAPNARKGLKAVLARPGDIIPSTKQALKVGKVRDVESFGMMCSAEELHLGEGPEGIIEVDRDAPVGEPYAKWIGLDEILIDIEISPNRGDCLGVYGIARDLSAAGIGKLKPLKLEKIKGSYSCPVSLKADPEACPHFTGRVIRGLKNGSSPLWLQKKLEAIGLRPISALVDITNFFTHDQARPLHVFDADKIKGNLNIRLSEEGESFKALDGKTYTLSDDMTVIADDSGVISLAGVMGGESTGCDEATHTIFLESAFFDPIRTAITGRSLGILSDSRYRFERGVDPASTLPGLEAATQMILEICGGEASDVIVAGAAPDLRQSIVFDPLRVKTLGGLEVSPQRAQDILTSLGFEVKGEGNNLTVLTPTWRSDVEQESDLVEEVLRVEGYDKIPSTPYGDRPEQKPLSPLQERRFIIRERLANRGLTEVVTWSFMSREDTEAFGGAPDSLVLLNPISQDLDTMRPSLLPNLLKAVLSNQNRGAETVGIFEVGPQYSDSTPQGQHVMVSGIRVGALHSDHWLEKKRLVDIYDAKADVIYVLSGTTVQYDRNAPSWYHPGRSATVKLGPNVLGYFGEIHPRILKEYDVKGPVVAFEIFIDRIPLAKRKSKSKLVLSPFQRVERDFAFVLDNNTPAENLIKAVQKADPILIKDINLFDVFNLGGDKKSLAIRVSLQPQDRTLTEEEIQAISQKIISLVAHSTGGVLRQ
jgi:phenylalanyl-tRNA synthetase beta chain